MENETNVQELEVNHDDYDSDSEESTTDSSQTELEIDEDFEGSDAASRAKSQIDRLKAEKAELKKKLSSYEPETSSESHNQATSGDKIARLELKVEGIKDSEAQDFVLEYAQTKNISITEALNSRIVKAELKEIEEAARSKNASVSPNNRTSNRNTNDVAYWAAQTEKGKSAPTAEMRKKVRDYLASD